MCANGRCATARYLLTTASLFHRRPSLRRSTSQNYNARDGRAPRNCIAYFVKSHSYALSAARKPNFGRTLYISAYFREPRYVNATAIEETRVPELCSFFYSAMTCPTLSVFFAENDLNSFQKIPSRFTLTRKEPRESEIKKKL